MMVLQIQNSFLVINKVTVIKKYEEMFDKIIYLIMIKNNNSDNRDDE